jgi:hypothetical protein
MHYPKQAHVLAVIIMRPDFMQHRSERQFTGHHQLISTFFLTSALTLA